jgi:hypothetical protein
MVDLLTDLKNMAVCQEWDKQDFNFQKHGFGNSFYETAGVRVRNDQSLQGKNWETRVQSLFGPLLKVLK